MSELDPIEAAIEAIRDGRMIIVVDDDDRENEGDLIMAAATATPEQVAFMVRHTSGILCTPMPAADAARLRLQPMVSVNDAPLQTAFTVSVDYRYRAHHRHLGRGAHRHDPSAGQPQCRARRTSSAPAISSR